MSKKFTSHFWNKDTNEIDLNERLCRQREESDNILFTLMNKSNGFRAEKKEIKVRTLRSLSLYCLELIFLKWFFSYKHQKSNKLNKAREGIQEPDHKNPLLEHAHTEQCLPFLGFVAGHAAPTTTNFYV